MFYQISHSPHVKRSAIIRNKHGIYELRHELPKDLRPRILGNKEKSKKYENFMGFNLSTQSSSQN